MTYFLVRITVYTIKIYTFMNISPKSLNINRHTFRKEIRTLQHKVNLNKFIPIFLFFIDTTSYFSTIPYTY